MRTNTVIQKTARQSAYDAEVADALAVFTDSGHYFRRSNYTNAVLAARKAYGGEVVHGEFVVSEVGSEFASIPALPSLSSPAQLAELNGS